MTKVNANNLSTAQSNTLKKLTEAQWHIGMLCALYWDPWRVLGSNLDKGEYKCTCFLHHMDTFNHSGQMPQNI